MPEITGRGWRLMAESGLVSQEPCRLDRIVLLVGTDGGDCTLYDGLNDQGRKITQVKGLASHPRSMEFGIHCCNGLHYVEGTNVTSCLIVFDPLPLP